MHMPQSTSHHLSKYKTWLRFPDSKYYVGGADVTVLVTYSLNGALGEAREIMHANPWPGEVMPIGTLLYVSRAVGTGPESKLVNVFERVCRHEMTVNGWQPKVGGCWPSVPMTAAQAPAQPWLSQRGMRGFGQTLPEIPKPPIPGYLTLEECAAEQSTTQKHTLEHAQRQCMRQSAYAAAGGALVAGIIVYFIAK